MLKKLALVAYIVNRLGKINGKKALQKIVYFASKIVGLDYHYKMYWYGPFSKELAELLDYLMIQGLVKIEEQNRGVKIEFNFNDNSIRMLDELKKNLSEDEQNKVDSLLKKLSDLTPRELELLATLDFIRTDIGIRDEEEESSILKNLKGNKFNDSDLIKARKILSELFEEI